LARYIYNDAEDHPELVMVPKVRAKLNAGGGSLITSDEIVGRFAFRSDWIRLKGDPDRMVLMDVFGESMEPVIWDGDTVLIDQHQTELTPGRIYAVGIDGTVVVKYVDMKPGALILRSANPRWEDIEVSCQDDLEDSVKIIGRVIWWCREAR
jgi:phage repressor protein C with HTH and peptisase S24 domain